MDCASPEISKPAGFIKPDIENILQDLSLIFALAKPMTPWPVSSLIRR